MTIAIVALVPEKLPMWNFRFSVSGLAHAIQFCKRYPPQTVHIQTHFAWGVAKNQPHTISTVFIFSLGATPFVWASLSKCSGTHFRLCGHKLVLCWQLWQCVDASGHPLNELELKNQLFLQSFQHFILKELTTDWTKQLHFFFATAGWWTSCTFGCGNPLAGVMQNLGHLPWEPFT